MKTETQKTQRLNLNATLKAKRYKETRLLSKRCYAATISEARQILALKRNSSIYKAGKGQHRYFIGTFFEFINR